MYLLLFLFFLHENRLGNLASSLHPHEKKQMFLCFLGYMNILLWARPCISFAFPVMVLGYVEMKVALDWCCSLL